MKLKNLLLVSALVFSGLAASAQVDSIGGPDKYGYTFKTNKYLLGGAPTYNWIDISTKGTNNTAGLGDDNALPSFIPVGFNFHYYYSDYNKVRIGSNGWIAFNNVGNIAANPFPVIPTPGAQGDNFIAALLTDLSFGGTGNPGKLYTYTNTAKDTFIVSYVDVPYFEQPSSFRGKNTFQFILSAIDSSITIQYKDMDPVFNGSGGTTDVQGGIENVSGGDGIQAFVNAIPTNGTALKYYYPKYDTLKVADVSPLWNQNDANGGFFIPKGTAPVTIRTNIGNVGNKDVSNITVAGTTRKGSTTKQLGSKIIPSLAADKDTTINISTTFVPDVAGTYRLTVNTTLTGDQNGANNQRITEMIIVDTASNKIDLKYVSGAVPDGILGLTGDDVGGGIYIEPPYYPCALISISSLLVDTTGSLTSTGPIVGGEYTAQIMDNDGPNGTPGTQLFTISTSEGVYGAFNEIVLPDSLIIYEGGVYINIFPGNAGRLTTEASSNSLPASLRTFEILGGNASPYRGADGSDFMIGATISRTNRVGINTNVNDVLTYNYNYPNPAKDFTTISYSLKKYANVSLKVTNMIGQQIEAVQFGEQNSGNHKFNLNTSTYDSGIYFYTLEVNGEQSTGKMMISK